MSYYVEIDSLPGVLKSALLSACIILGQGTRVMSASANLRLVSTCWLPGAFCHIRESICVPAVSGTESGSKILWEERCKWNMAVAGGGMKVEYGCAG